VDAVDVMGFAGSFAVGVSQAGFNIVAKREPSAFQGFGAAAFERNMPEVQVEVTAPEFWSIVKADLLYGCPPCSGFSMLSTNNTADSNRGPVDEFGVRHSLRGVDSPVNQWMWRLMEYAAKVKPSVVVMESVQGGGKMGAPLMRALWQDLRERTGMDYHLTDVFMNAATVGGHVIRPRYFYVAHLRPFGVDLPHATPKPMKEVIGDLLEADGTRLTPGIDTDWGHVTGGSPTSERVAKTIELFRSKGFDWKQGKRLPEHLDVWVNQMGEEVPEWWYKADGTLYSHAISDNMYSPFRWRWEEPMGVVAGGFMERAVHPVAARNFTYREGARLMGLPDTWSLRPIVEGNNGPWLGKAVTVAAGRFIAVAAHNSIAGTPGEYAGVLVEPKHRVIDVTTPRHVAQIEKGQDAAAAWWPDRPRKTYYTDSIGQTGRPSSWAGAPAPAPKPIPAPVAQVSFDGARKEDKTVVVTRPVTKRFIPGKVTLDVQVLKQRVEPDGTRVIEEARVLGVDDRRTFRFQGPTEDEKRIMDMPVAEEDTAAISVNFVKRTPPRQVAPEAPRPAASRPSSSPALRPTNGATYARGTVQTPANVQLGADTVKVKKIAVAKPSAGSTITRIPPEEVQALLDQLGLNREQAAAALGCSKSRIAEMTSHTRPGSWVNSAKWPDLVEKLTAYQA